MCGYGIWDQQLLRALEASRFPKGAAKQELQTQGPGCQTLDQISYITSKAWGQLFNVRSARNKVPVYTTEPCCKGEAI